MNDLGFALDMKEMYTPLLSCSISCYLVLVFKVFFCIINSYSFHSKISVISRAIHRNYSVSMHSVATVNGAIPVYL